MNLIDHGYVHKTVNHSEEFVNQEISAHKDNIADHLCKFLRRRRIRKLNAKTWIHSSNWKLTPNDAIPLVAPKMWEARGFTIKKHSDLCEARGLTVNKHPDLWEAIFGHHIGFAKYHQVIFPFSSAILDPPFLISEFWARSRNQRPQKPPSTKYHSNQVTFCIFIRHIRSAFSYFLILILDS